MDFSKLLALQNEKFYFQISQYNVKHSTVLPKAETSVQGLPDWLANMMAFWVGHDASEKKSRFHFTVAG